jgi:hypothetical protein
VEHVSGIAGASAVKSKALKAYTWKPPQVTEEKAQIIKALETLVTAASGEELDGPTTAPSPDPGSRQQEAAGASQPSSGHQLRPELVSAS